LDEGGYVAAIRQERADGSIMTSEVAWIDTSGVTRYAVIDGHDVQFDADTRILLSASIRAHAVDGAPVTLDVGKIGEGIRLSGAGYVAGQGTASDSASNGETWDLNDPEVLAGIGPGTIDSPIRAQFSVDGETYSGTGVSEFAIARNHHRYGERLR
jgi:hypothetical protein